MAEHDKEVVSMRVRVGDAELEVSGRQEFVEKKINDFLREQRELQAHQASGLAKTLGAHETLPSGVQTKGMSIGQFFRKSPPKNDVDRVLMAGYFLEKFEGMDSFTTAEIADTIRKSKNNPPGNPSDTIAKNIKKGLMMSAGDKDGKRAFVLTTDGEEAVTVTLNQA